MRHRSKSYKRRSGFGKQKRANKRVNSYRITRGGVRL